MPTTHNASWDDVKKAIKKSKKAQYYCYFWLAFFSGQIFFLLTFSRPRGQYYILKRPKYNKKCANINFLKAPRRAPWRCATGCLLASQKKKLLLCWAANLLVRDVFLKVGDGFYYIKFKFFFCFFFFRGKQLEESN